jgi:hypothetical protein
MGMDDSLNRRAEDTAGSDGGNGHNGPVARLAALAMHLGARGLDVAATDDGLVARNRNRPDAAHTITCGPRRDDGDRLWFFALGGWPIAEADRIIEAAVAISGLLTSAELEGDERT